MDTELSASKIGSRSRDRNMALVTTDVNLTQAGELKVILRKTSERSCCGVGDKHAFLKGVSKDVRGLTREWGVLRTGFSGLHRWRRSTRRSVLLFPSTVTWEGTLTHCVVFPRWSSSWRSCSQMLTLATGPQHPFQSRSFHRFATAELLREVRGGWGGSSVEQMTPTSFGSKIMNLWVFLTLSRKGVFRSRLQGVYIGWSGTSANAVYALFSHFCYVGGLGDLSDPMVPIVRGVSRDVVKVYAY